MMKRYIALTLAALMLAMTACSSAETEESAADANAPAENVEEVMSEESAEEAEEEKKHERPEDVEVIDYKTLKLEKAASMLTTTDTPVALIAESLGFDDQHAFSKLFKKYWGVSPMAYRKVDTRGAHR